MKIAIIALLALVALIPIFLGWALVYFAYTKAKGEIEAEKAIERIKAEEEAFKRQPAGSTVS